jgi:hypothetical protein
MENAELEVKIENDELVIHIGISTLCASVRNCSVIDEAVMNADGDESSVVIYDETVFATGIISALGREEEDGSTLIHRMLDNAAESAIESGCEGIEFRD